MLKLNGLKHAVNFPFENRQQYSELSSTVSTIRRWIFDQDRYSFYKYHPFDRESFQLWLRVRDISTGPGDGELVLDHWTKVDVGYRNVEMKPERFLSINKNFEPVWLTNSYYIKVRRQQQKK